MPETLFEKVWNRHVVTSTDEATLFTSTGTWFTR